MIIDDAIANYKRYHTREICATIRSLSNNQKQRLLDSIQCRKEATHLLGQTHNQQACDYIESLLNGKRPRNGLC